MEDIEEQINKYVRKNGDEMSKKKKTLMVRQQRYKDNKNLAKEKNENHTRKKTVKYK